MDTAAAIEMLEGMRDEVAGLAKGCAITREHARQRELAYTEVVKYFTHKIERLRGEETPDAD